MRLNDSRLSLCIHCNTRIAHDVRSGIVSVARETLMPEMIMRIVLKIKLFAAFKQQHAFACFCQYARGDTSTCASTDNDHIVTVHSRLSNPIIRQAIQSRLPPLPGSL